MRLPHYMNTAAGNVPRAGLPDFAAAITENLTRPARVRTRHVPELRDNAIDTLGSLDKSMTLGVRPFRAYFDAVSSHRAACRELKDRFVPELRAARQFVVDKNTLERVARRSFDEGPDGAQIVYDLLAAPHAKCWFECAVDPAVPVYGHLPCLDTHEIYVVAESVLVIDMQGGLYVQPFETLQFVPRDSRYGAHVRTETLPTAVAFIVASPDMSDDDRRHLAELSDSTSPKLLAPFSESDLARYPFVRRSPDFLSAPHAHWGDNTRGLREHVYPVFGEAYKPYAEHGATCAGIVDAAVVRSARELNDKVQIVLQRLASPVNPMQWFALIAHINAASPPVRLPPAPDGAVLPAATHVDYRERSVVVIDLDASYGEWAARARRSIRILRRKKRHEVRGTYVHRGLDPLCTHTWESQSARRWHCAGCGGRRWWRDKHERGDSTLGYVIHTYVVSGTRRREIV